MLNIFKSFSAKTSLLDDFNFYENQEKSLNTKKSNKPVTLRMKIFENGDFPVFETVQQPHDVPFGSYFEIHCRWSLETHGENSCTMDIKVGAHFKKWCVMQSKIRSGAINEYKKEVELMLEMAPSCANKSHTSIGETTDNPSSSPITTQDNS